SSAKTAVTECIQNANATAGCASTAAVGVAPATDITSNYVESLTIGADGLVTVAIRGSNDAALESASNVLTPTLSATGGGVNWSCRPSLTTINKYLPASCRST